MLAATWYPGEDMIPLLEAVAKVLGEPEQGFYEKAGRQSAQLHADGVYKHLVRAEDAEGFARRALVLWSSQHDTGRTDTRTDERGRVRLHRGGLRVQRLQARARAEAELLRRPRVLVDRGLGSLAARPTRR